TQKLAELEKQLAQRDAEKQQLSDNILALTGENSQQREALKKDLSALTAEKADLEKQVAGLKADNAQAEKNLALLQDKNAD
ncbi:hypothetical protein, partial [Morganella morganii]|nr:hypothetical protein [Morganella morganii]